MSFEAVTKTRYRFFSLLFVCLLCLAARQKINVEFKNHQDETSEEKINEVLLGFVVFFHFS